MSGGRPHKRFIASEEDYPRLVCGNPFLFFVAQNFPPRDRTPQEAQNYFKRVHGLVKASSEGEKLGFRLEPQIC